MSSILRPRIARAFLPLLEPRRFKGARGGRGSGKSRFFAGLAIMEAVSGHQRFVCGREIQNSVADSVKQTLEDEIARFGLMDGFGITDTEIIYRATETLFVFKGLQKHTTAAVKSMEGFTRLWLEEAQTISQKSLNMATPTFRAPGSQIWAAWNPESEKDPIDRLFLENADDPHFACVTVNYYDNPWFPAELREDMERDRRRDPEKYSHIWLGKYAKRSEAAVFRNWRSGALEIPEGARPYFGADWGFSIDPTVLVRCWIWDRTLYVDREVYQIGCEIDRTPELFDKINDARVPSVRKWPIVADSARPETISYMRQHGFPNIESARKGPGSVEEGVEFLKSYDIVVHPDCRHTSDELGLYAYKVDKKTDEVLPELDDKSNHVIDSLRYAVERLRHARRAPLSLGYTR